MQGDAELPDNWAPRGSDDFRPILTVISKSSSHSSHMTFVKRAGRIIYLNKYISSLHSAVNRLVQRSDLRWQNILSILLSEKQWRLFTDTAWCMRLPHVFELNTFRKHRLRMRAHFAYPSQQYFSPQRFRSFTKRKTKVEQWNFNCFRSSSSEQARVSTVIKRKR